MFFFIYFCIENLGSLWRVWRRVRREVLVWCMSCFCWCCGRSCWWWSWVILRRSLGCLRSWMVCFWSIWGYFMFLISIRFILCFLGKVMMVRNWFRKICLLLLRINLGNWCSRDCMSIIEGGIWLILRRRERKVLNLWSLWWGREMGLSMGTTMLMNKRIMGVD